MSFSRTFTFGVSGSVSYPSSEHGGTVSYHDSIDVTVVVDTSDFDRSVQRCDSEVESLRGSIIERAREAISEKARSAGRIAGAMASGFFKYISFGVREKLMRLTSRIPMMIEALKNLAKHAAATRSQLERDYTQITSRYARIFDDLHSNLRSALVALDRPLYQAADQAKGVVFESVLRGAAESAVGGTEDMGAANSIEMSQVKSSTRRVLSECSRNIMYNIRLGQQIEHMLRRGDSQSEHFVYMPVVQVEARPLDGGDAIGDYLFSGAFPPERADELRAVAQESGGGFENTLSAANAVSAVDVFYRARVSADAARYSDAAMAERVTAEMLRMWSADIAGAGNLTGEEE